MVSLREKSEAKFCSEIMLMKFNPTQILKQKPSLVWREVDDGVVIVSPAGGEVRALNKLGSTIWTMLDGTKSAEQIIATLKSSYPSITEEQLQNDFIIFIDSLVSRDLVDELQA